MRISWTTLIYPLVALVASLAHAKSSSGDSVLVFLDPSQKKEDYSIFLSSLEERGYDLTFRAPKETQPAVIQDDIPSFSHIIFLSSESKTYASDVTPQTLVEVLSAGTNLLIVLSPKQTPLSSLAAEFSLILPPPGTPLLSHFPARPEPPTVLPINITSSPLLTPNTPPIWFSGSSHALGNNPLLIPIVRAPAESFASDAVDDASADMVVDASEKGGEGLWAGSQMGVITGFQTNALSRVVFAGSAEMFSDEYIRKEINGVKAGNEQLVNDISTWAFRESLVLRIDETTHHRVNEDTSREAYTTNDQVVYTAFISAYDPSSSTWYPYSDIQDLQLEFTMLDPHVRLPLLPVPGKPGRYELSFRVPDRHGVFKFVVNWRRRGYTYLFSSTTVPVVPPRHDEYPRFLSAAWPYYAGAMSTSVGFVVFAAGWLATGVLGKAKGKKAVKAAKTE